MSERKRGIICAYCGIAWGYDDESPTPELIKEACDHESICEKNPYTAQIRKLERERDEAREVNTKLRDITERAINYLDQSYRDGFADEVSDLRYELAQIKEETK